MILEVVRNDFFGKTTVDSEKQRISARRTGRKIISIKASCSQMGIGTGISRDYEFYSDQQFV
jgi:hypothetical protein